MPGSPSEIAQHARAAGRLGVDTEFMGEGRYQSLLCLVQTAVEAQPTGANGEPRIDVLDPLTQDLDAAPLAAVLSDPGVEVVVHAGRQDVALLRRAWDTEVRNVFDTQVAAGFAGLRAQLGYEALLHEMLGVRLRKTASFTRWDTRPLSPEQVEYAREDVLHILQVGDALKDRLRAVGRLEWAREECRALEDVSDVRDPQAIFERLPRINSLDPSQRAVARELVEWREQVARESDRPVSSILNDAALVELAKRRPATTERLSHIRGINEGTLRRRGRTILAAIERGREREPIPPVGERGAPPDPDDGPLIALAEALVRTRAMEIDVAYELIASKADLQRVVTAVRAGAPEPDVRTMRGWRREVVGEELIELLAGRRTLRVGPGRRIAVSD